jgi:hypothetical protein
MSLELNIAMRREAEIGMEDEPIRVQMVCPSCRSRKRCCCCSSREEDEEEDSRQQDPEAKKFLRQDDTRGMSERFVRRIV